MLLGRYEVIPGSRKKVKVPTGKVTEKLRSREGEYQVKNRHRDRVITSDLDDNRCVYRRSLKGRRKSWG